MFAERSAPESIGLSLLWSNIMDINYLLQREQLSLCRAQTSPSRGARAAHRAFALAYGKLLVRSNYPHNRFAADANSALQSASNRPSPALFIWENEGGSLQDIPGSKP